MTTIQGSSRYYNAATLANQQGVAPSTPSLLGSGSTQSLLETGRGINSSGLGISGSARAVNSQLISDSRSGFNKIFSLNGVEFGNNETLKQEILAIRSRIPDSRLGPSTIGTEVDDEA